jgi:hypothetical protein
MTVRAGQGRGPVARDKLQNSQRKFALTAAIFT